MFHSVLVTSLLVVFGDKVTKILRDSLFIFHFVLPMQMENIAQNITRILSDKKTKTKPAKRYNEKSAQRQEKNV